MCVETSCLETKNTDLVCIVVKFMHVSIAIYDKTIQIAFVQTVPDPNSYDIKLSNLMTSVAVKFMMILKNLIKTNYKKSGKSRYQG